LIWQNQTALHDIKLQGSSIIGGFLVHNDLLQLLANNLRCLRTIQLAKCADLTVKQLSALVASRAAKHIAVQGCEKILARDCSALQQGCEHAVCLDWT